MKDSRESLLKKFLHDLEKEELSKEISGETPGGISGEYPDAIAGEIPNIISVGAYEEFLEGTSDGIIGKNIESVLENVLKDFPLEIIYKIPEKLLK